MHAKTFEIRKENKIFSSLIILFFSHFSILEFYGCLVVEIIILYSIIKNNKHLIDIFFAKEKLELSTQTTTEAGSCKKKTNEFDYVFHAKVNVKSVIWAS